MQQFGLIGKSLEHSFSKQYFTDFFLEDTWNKKGGNHKQLTSQLSMMNSLRNLANLTQQLYLNMPSYDEWIMEKWQKNLRKDKNIV